MQARRLSFPRRAQRGVTMIGLIFWAMAVGFIAYVAIRTLPTVNEYVTIQGAVDKIAAAPPGTVAEIRTAFDRQREIEYSIQSVTGKDLEITKENDKVVIAFSYEKEVPIGGPVYILLKYQGRSK
jgi:hypothetical protein